MSTQDARTRILETALDLFHGQGVNATGLGQILDASGTGKSQFYHYFSSKDDLVLEVMKHFRGKIASGEIPVPRDLATWRDLEEWFDFFLDHQRATKCVRSCPIGTIASDITENKGPLRDEATSIFRAGRLPLIALFTSLRAQGKLKRSTDPEELADFCYTVMQGGLLVSKIERRSEPFENAVRHALAHVRSLQS